MQNEMSEQDLKIIIELKSKAIKLQMYCLACQLREAERELFRVLNAKLSENILNKINDLQPK